MKNKLIRPFLKWAGGKRYLFPVINKMVPKYTTYIEPFVGGGAILFSLQPKQAVINDINSEVINVYKVIKEDVEELIENLLSHVNDSEYFYRLREIDRANEEFNEFSSIQKAARIIYLNKTCFNGLFRVNSQGQFNAPFGNYKNPNIVNEEVLRAVSKYLNENEISILNGSYYDLLNKINKGSFVYLDPPYDPISDTSSFTGYNLDKFGKDEQKKLKLFCDKLDDQKINFLLSNSDTDFIRDLYNDRERKYLIDEVQVPRTINSVASKRGKISEVLVRNYNV